MAPGVGKTYKMLEEGHEEKARGRDVVIGYLEAHGRADTSSEASGLETVPRRRLRYRGASLEEMNLPAILRRRPELCLIDELAHTNVSGSEHTKRHEDVDVVLAAGIDVYSTVNVQHVHTLAGEIGTLTGIRVRETMPDQVLDDADDVVLVDITPALLLERLRAGKIYPQASAAVAEGAFFRPDKLAALREISLLKVAEAVEPRRKPQAHQPAGGTATSSVLRLTADRPLRPSSGCSRSPPRNRDRGPRSTTPSAQRSDCTPRSTFCGSGPMLRRSRRTRTSPRSAGWSPHSVAT